jgi:hypothetical protein
MSKNSNCKLLFITIIVTILLSSSVYAALIHDVHAAEMTTRQKGLAALNNLVDLDLAKYAVTTEENGQYPRSLGTVFEETVLYDFTSANSKLKAFCTFANGNLQGMRVFENEGTPSLTKAMASVNDVERAQDFLSKYQAYTAKPIFGELKSTLNNVDAGKNVTKTFGDKILQVTAYGDCTLFKWYYTANGVTAPYTKVISIGFKDGFFTSFIDDWDRYSIGSTSVNLTKDEAVAIALDTARNHSWTMQLDEDALDERNFNEKRSVPWTVLTFDGSLDADKTRSENILELYPVWRVGLVLNKVYGELYGIEVDIWADTKEVRSVKEEYSQLAAQLFENNTANVGTSAAIVNGAQSNFVIGIMLSATTIGITGAVAAGLFKKKNPRALSWLKPRFLKTCVILLGFLMLLAMFSPLIATANATTRAGNVWGSRSTGAPNPPHHSWRKQDDEITRQWNASSYIASNCFSAANGYTGYNNEATNKDTIIYQAGYFRDNYNYVAIVDFDHGVGNVLSPGEFHYMFEDDWGTVVGSPPGTPSLSHGVYDKDIYNVFPPAKVHFAFISACMSARIASTAVTTGYPLVYGGGLNANGTPEGMPFAFTHRQVSSQYPPIGTAMSFDGYNYPDNFPQCYIGFPFGSAALNQHINYSQTYGSGPYWCDWVEEFFYYALNFDVSVNAALDYASQQMKWDGCTGFSNSPLRGSGFAAVWPMDTDGDGVYTVGPDDIGLHSTLAVYGNGNIHLKNFQPSDIVTVPCVSGPTTGYASTSYQFSTSSIDSQGHNIKYRFDWGDGSSYTETDWCSNGATAYASHSWSSNGLYSVRVQAKCSNGGWGSWSSLHYVNIGYLTAQLTTYAYNQYGMPGYVPLYIDGNYVGTTGYTYTVLLGSRQVYVLSPLSDAVFNHYVYDGNWYSDNPLTIVVTGDKTLTAYYYWYY